MSSGKSQRFLDSELAGIQYIGLTGITGSCISAIARQLSGNELVAKAALITCLSDHAFLLFTEFDGAIAIKSGFASGYSGEGPRGLAVALMLLHQHNVPVDEFKVTRSFFNRLEYSCLLQSDITAIESGDPIRPNRWYDYIHEQGFKLHSPGKRLSRYYPAIMPFGIIDERLIDLAVKFHGNEDSVLISAFRRLEDLLRKRTGLTGEGVKLFSKVFMSDDSPLRWNVPDDGELKGRGSLFIATYMAFRNARVHREVDSGGDAFMREFLLVNELYRLEGEAMTDSEIRKVRGEEAQLAETKRELDRDNYFE